MFDDSIVEKWRRETVTEPNAEIPAAREFTASMFNFCIAELRYRASVHTSSPNGAVLAFSGDVYKSDEAVSEATKVALQKAIKVLEDVPDAKKDWHPGSNNQVLDLVHPSLYPFVYGKTRVLAVGADETTLEDCISRSGEGDIVRLPNDPAVNGFSTRFQWLPCDVDVSGEKPRSVTHLLEHIAAHSSTKDHHLYQ